MIAWEYVEERVKHKASMACVFFGLCRDLAISGVSPPSHFDEERLELSWRGKASLRVQVDDPLGGLYMARGTKCIRLHKPPEFVIALVERALSKPGVSIEKLLEETAAEWPEERRVPSDDFAK